MQRGHDRRQKDSRYKGVVNVETIIIIIIII
jgi:hypothetical protein